MPSRRSWSRYGDLEPRMPYQSRRRRRMRFMVRIISVTAVICALVILFGMRILKVARCAEAGGFYENTACNGAECCEVVVPRVYGNQVHF